MTQLREIHLHGVLGEACGPLHHLNVQTTGEAIRALVFTRPGFRDAMREGSYELIRGDLETGYHITEQSFSMGLGKAPLHIVPAPEGAGGGKGTGKIIIGVAIIALAVVTAGAAAAAAPALAGAGAAGAAGTVGAAAGATAGAVAGLAGATAGGLGAGLGLSIGVAGITFGQIAGIGASLLLSGISTLMTPSPKTNAGSTPAQNASYIFSGASNTSVEGSCVPLVYGKVLTGSVVMAANIDAVDITASGGVTNTATNGVLGQYIYT